MSKLKGEKIIEHNNKIIYGHAFVRYVKKTEEFAFKFPFEIYRNDINLTQSVIYIKEEDLWRMVRMDRYDYFDFIDEQGDLDDQTYASVSVAQRLWYISINTIKVVKRQHPNWYVLKRKVARGGRPKGSKAVVSEDDKERLQFLYDNYDKLVLNCIKHDWAEEYCELEKDIATFLNQPYKGRKDSIQRFTKLRRDYFKKH